MAQATSPFTTHQQFKIFQEKRQTLLNLIQRQRQIIDALDMKGRQEVLARLSERVQADNFKVLVLGEFKRGKSTFINAMLGEKILPAYARPTTAIINEIKWGDAPRALLHAADRNGSTPPPQEVPIRELEHYVTIQDGLQQGEAIRQSPYEKVELFWPLKLCQSGVEIIDSPGLNEHEVRQKVTMDYLSTVDAILFVLSCEVLGSMAELDVIDNTLRAMGHEDLFFICNRFNMIDPDEQEDIRKHGLTKLAPRTKHGADRIFFINALGALKGRLAGSLESVEQTGVPHLERELERFLATERGRVKILRPAIELKNAIQEARRIIPEREAMLRLDNKTLEARYQEAQEPLRQLETKRQQIVTQLDNFREDMKLLVSDRATEFYRSLVDEVKTWSDAYELQTPVKFFSLEGLKSQVERAVQELVEHLSQRVETAFATWQRSELQPLIQQRLADRKQELDTQATEFVNQLDDLRFQVTGISVDNISTTDLGKRKVTPLERILSAAGGFLIAGVGAAGIGAIYGYEEMLKSLLPQILLSAATIILVGFNPWVIIPVMAGGGIIQGLLSTQGTNKKLKEVVSQKYAAEIRSSSYEQVNKLADAVAIELDKIRSAVDQGLHKEIQSVREQVNSILTEKQKGQANVEQKLQELDTLALTLNQIDSELDDLITQVAL